MSIPKEFRIIVQLFTLFMLNAEYTLSYVFFYFQDDSLQFFQCLNNFGARALQKQIVR